MSGPRPRLRRWRGCSSKRTRRTSRRCRTGGARTSPRSSPSWGPAWPRPGARRRPRSPPRPARPRRPSSPSDHSLSAAGRPHLRRLGTTWKILETGLTPRAAVGTVRHFPGSGQPVGAGRSGASGRADPIAEHGTRRNTRHAHGHNHDARARHYALRAVQPSPARVQAPEPDVWIPILDITDELEALDLSAELEQLELDTARAEFDDELHALERDFWSTAPRRLEEAVARIRKLPVPIPPPVAAPVEEPIALAPAEPAVEILPETETASG